MGVGTRVSRTMKQATYREDGPDGLGKLDDHPVDAAHGTMFLPLGLVRGIGTVERMTRRESHINDRGSPLPGGGADAPLDESDLVFDPAVVAVKESSVEHRVLVGTPEMGSPFRPLEVPIVSEGREGEYISQGR
jgi:hypothetical protein